MPAILIVDDHPLIIDSLKTIIENSNICEVSGTATSANECLNFVATRPTDLILLDINLPDGNGIELCKQIHQKYPSIKIIALTSFNEFSIIRKMMDSGAMGYILKNAMPEEIIYGIETVLNGDTFLCHEADMLINKKIDQQIFLTPRESDLLKLICEGYTNPEIAERLFLSTETINSYRKNLLFKLNARNTAVLVRIALEKKLI